MYYTIYQITNLVNGKIYIGKHQTNDLADGYFGSGTALKKAIAKHGKDVFRKDILHVFNNEAEMNAKEKELITEDFVRRLDTYNLGVGGEGGPHFEGRKHSDQTRQKLAEIRQINPIVYTDELRRKMSEKNKGRVVSDLTKQKLSQLANERYASDGEVRKKISAAMKQYCHRYPMSDETKQKLHLAHVGKRLSDDHKDKIRTTMLSKSTKDWPAIQQDFDNGLSREKLFSKHNITRNMLRAGKAAGLFVGSYRSRHN